VKEVLQRLGMDELSPIESAMVARRIHRAQNKLAGRPEPDRVVNSAEEWLQATASE
jgi:hypothetical protein